MIEIWSTINNDENRKEACNLKTWRQSIQRWSETKLRLLELCPLAFKFQYLDQVKVSQSVEKVFGSAVHYMLARYFSLKNGYVSADSFVASFIHFWDGVLKGEHGPSGFLDPPVEIRSRRTDPKMYYGIGREI